MEKSPKKEHSMCHICLKKSKAVPAVHVCLDCSSAPRYLCDSCLETHHSWFEDHQTLNMTEFTEGKHQEMCSNHASKKATLVCSECDVLLCPACENAGPCTKSAGRKHTCVQKHVYLERLKVQLHLNIGACVNHCAVLGEKIRAIGNWDQSAETDQVSKDIDSHTEDIIRKVRDLSSENKRKAQNLREKKEMSLKKSRSVLTDLKESNAKGQRICEKVLTSKSIAKVQAALDEVEEYQKEVPAKEMSGARILLVLPGSHEMDAMLRVVKGHSRSAELTPLETIAVKGPHNLCVQSMFNQMTFNEVILLASGHYLEVINNKLYQVDKKGWRTQINDSSISCFCISQDRLKCYCIGEDEWVIYQYDLEEETGTLSGKMKYASAHLCWSVRSMRISSLNQLAVLCGEKVLVYEHGELKQTVSSSSMGVQLFDSPTSVTWSTDGKKLLVADSTNRKVQTTTWSRSSRIPSTRTDVHQHVVCLTLDPPKIRWETQVDEHTNGCVRHLLCMDEFIYAVSSSKEESTHQIYVLKADTGDLVKNKSGRGRAYGLSNNQGTVQVFVHSSL